MSAAYSSDRFAIFSDFELECMRCMERDGHAPAAAIYRYFRQQMDWVTCVVGQARRISYRAIQELLETKPRRGSRVPADKPSEGKIRGEIDYLCASHAWFGDDHLPVVMMVRRPSKFTFYLPSANDALVGFREQVRNVQRKEFGAIPHTVGLLVDSALLEQRDEQRTSYTTTTNSNLIIREANFEFGDLLAVYHSILADFDNYTVGNEFRARSWAPVEMPTQELANRVAAVITKFPRFCELSAWEQYFMRISFSDWLMGLSASNGKYFKGGFSGVSDMAFMARVLNGDFD